MLRLLDSQGRITYKDKIYKVKLRFNEGAIDLEFTGASAIGRDFNRAAPEQHLFGEFNVHGKCTFVNCRLLTRDTGTIIQEVILRAEAIIAGAHMLMETVLKTVVFDLSGYGEYLNTASYRLEGLEKEKVESISLETTRWPIDIKSCKEAFLQIGTDVIPSDNRLILVRRVFIRMDFVEGQSLEQILKIKQRVRQLFTFLSGESQIVAIEELFDRTNKKRIQYYSKEIEGHWSSFDRTRFEEVKERLSELITKWITIDDIGKISELILHLNSLHVNPELQFLNSCFALETTHRAFYNYEDMPRRSLWKKSRGRTNKPTLAERIIELSVADSSREGTTIDTRLAKTIADVRNILVHGLNKEIDPTFNMIYTTELMDNMVKSLLLSDSFMTPK